MKKSIAIILALVLMMTVVLFGCGKKEKEADKPEQDTAVQAGNTDPSGNTGTSEDSTPSDVTGVTDATASTGATNVSDVTPSTTPTTTTNPAGITAPSKPDFSTSQPDNSQQTTPVQPTTNVDKYKQIFASGTYSMTITTVTNGVEDIPIDFACKNGNIRMSMSMEGIPATMIYMAQNDTVYMLFEMMGKFYTELTEELLGEEINFSEVSEGFRIPDNATITTASAQFDGKTVTAETVTSEKKASVFYFDANGTLLGIETTEENGSVSVTKISNLTTTVDDSLFEIPASYKYMDLSWLMNMA